MLTKPFSHLHQSKRYMRPSKKTSALADQRSSCSTPHQQPLFPSRRLLLCHRQKPGAPQLAQPTLLKSPQLEFAFMSQKPAGHQGR